MDPSHNEPIPLNPRRNLWTVLITNQFSIFIRGPQFIHGLVDRLSAGDCRVLVQSAARRDGVRRRSGTIAQTRLQMPPLLFSRHTTPPLRNAAGRRSGFPVNRSEV